MSNLPSGYNEPESLDSYLARVEKNMDEMEGLLLWVLYHHQGGSSTIGQPIRKLLGIGEHDHMTRQQVEKAQIAGGVR
jgi:hypothetical protein